MIRRPLLVALTVGLIIFTGTRQLAASAVQSINAPNTGSPVSSQRGVLNTYCVTCHNEKLKTAGLMLDKLDIDRVGEGGATWEKVLGKLRSGDMPPAGRPRPDQSTYDSLATYLETKLDSAATATPNPGRPAIHRLNRAEYVNA